MDGTLTSIAVADWGHLAHSSAGQVACDWEGDRAFAGTNDCDDFLFGCYGGSLWSATFVGDLHATQACNGYSCPSISDGTKVTCNFGQPMRASGVNDDDDFYLTCEDGELTSVMKADQSAERPRNHSVMYRRGEQTCVSWGTAHGSWKLVASSNMPFTHGVTYGTETSDTDTLTQEFGISLTISIEAGFDFFGNEGKQTVSTEYSYKLAQQTSHTFTQSYGQTFQFQCPYGGMYQWIMKNGRPWQQESQYGTFVSTQIMWCTLDTSEPPQCPPTACDCGGSLENCTCQKCLQFEGEHKDVSFVPPKCDWTGGRRISGVGLNDDYILTCSDHVLSAISTAEESAGRFSSDVQASSFLGCSACDWDGVRYFAGANDNDDLYLHCCSDSHTMIGIAAVDGFDPQAPGSENLGIPCQWVGKRRASGTYWNDDFWFTCTEGILTKVEAIPDRFGARIVI